MTSSHDFDASSYWFYFDGEPHSIAIQCSAWSGMEKFYVNNELVSSRRNWRRNSEHQFSYEGHSFRVRFKVRNMLTGRVSCTLFCDDIEMGSEELAYTDNKAPIKEQIKGPLLIPLLMGMVFGVIATGVQAYFSWPLWKNIAVMIAIIVALFALITLVQRLMSRK